MNRAFLMLWVVALGALVLPGCHVHLHVGERHIYDGQNSGGERSLSDISEELLNVGQTQDQ